MSKRLLRVLCAGLALSLVASACGDDDAAAPEPAPSTTEAPAPEPAPSTTEAPAPDPILP